MVGGCGDRPLFGRLEVAREELVEGSPVRRVFVPALVESEGAVGLRHSQVLLVPRLWRIEECSPRADKGFQPGTVGFRILYGVVEVPTAFELLKRLVDNKVKVGETLVDALIQGRIRFRLEQARRNGSLGPCNEVEVLLKRLCGIREPVRVDLLRPLDRGDQKALEFGIG